MINLRQIFEVSPLIVINFLNLTQRILYTSKNQLFIVKGYLLKDYVRRHWHLKNTLSILSWIVKLVYPKKVVDNQLRRVVENRPEQLTENQTKHGTGVPLVITYHPRFHDLGRIIWKNFIYYAEEQVKQVFAPAPFVSFPSGFSLRNHLF